MKNNVIAYKVLRFIDNRRVSLFNGFTRPYQDVVYTEFDLIRAHRKSNKMLFIFDSLKSALNCGTTKPFINCQIWKVRANGVTSQINPKHLVEGQFGPTIIPSGTLFCTSLRLIEEIPQA